MLKKNEGFTLIEVIMVVVIIGLISNMAMVNFGSQKEKAREAVDQGNIANIMTAIELYEMDNEMYPEENETKTLEILLGSEDSKGEWKKYLRMEEEELIKYKYALIEEGKSYTISKEES